jgi:hypothetical protein
MSPCPEPWPPGPTSAAGRGRPPDGRGTRLGQPVAQSGKGCELLGERRLFAREDCDCDQLRTDRRHIGLRPGAPVHLDQICPRDHGEVLTRPPPRRCGGGSSLQSELSSDRRVQPLGHGQVASPAASTLTPAASGRTSSARESTTFTPATRAASSSAACRVGPNFRWSPGCSGANHRGEMGARPSGLPRALPDSVADENVGRRQHRFATSSRTFQILHLCLSEVDAQPPIKSFRGWGSVPTAC